MTDIVSFDAVIPDAGTKSPAINITDFFITGIQIPASMTGTALTLEVGLTADTTVQLRDETNAAISFTISSTAAAYPLDARLTAGFTYVKVVSGSSETGAKTIKLTGYRV